MAVLVIRANARHIPLRDHSVDVVVTSPPFFGQREYPDNGSKGYAGQIGAERTPQEYVAALIECTREMVRVLTRRGSIFVNLGDTYASYPANRGDGRMQKNTHRPSFPPGLLGGGAARNKSLLLVPERYRIACVDELNLIVSAVMIWDKPNPLPGGRLRDRVRSVHEDWVHLTTTDRYHHNQDELRAMGEGQMPPSVIRQPVARAPRGAATGRAHCAPFPVAWPSLFIRGWCPPGGVVLDPFGGSGTTALAAQRHDRTGISLDLSGDYCQDSHQRLHEGETDRQRS